MKCKAREWWMDHFLSLCELDCKPMWNKDHKSIQTARNNFHWRLRLLMERCLFEWNWNISFKTLGICDFYERFDKLSTSGYRVMDFKRENGQSFSSLVGTSERLVLNWSGNDHSWNRFHVVDKLSIVLSQKALRMRPFVIWLLLSWWFLIFGYWYLS